MQKSRIDILKSKLYENRLDGLIITNKNNIFYLSNITVEGILIIKKDENIFITLERYHDTVIEQIEFGSEIVIKTVEKTTDYNTIFKSDEVIGIEEKDVTVREYKQYKRMFEVDFKDCSFIVEELRRQKDDEEAKTIYEISKNLDEILREVRRELGVGQKEERVLNNIKDKILRRKMEIGNIKVAFGENTANIYHVPNSTKLKVNDVVIISISAKMNGYFSKIGRTFLVGFPEKEYPNIESNYLKLYKIHDEMLRNIHHNTNISKTAINCENKLKEISWNISYNFGHGIGIEEIEEPSFLNTSTKNFLENEVMVINPQINIKNNYGLLIEDTIKITHSNFILFTQEERNLDYIYI